MIRKNKRAQGGFTLIETILSAAILVVLLAISVTGAFLYRSHLKITELDNAAREIYLAAQNRAVLLNNRSALRPLVVRGDNELPSRAENELAYYFISSQDPQLSQLLPAGTVDPTLMNGSFYIVYEPESGSVTDVFFQQAAAFSIPGASDFNTYYRHQSYREKSARRQAEPMTGWYNGDPGEGGDAITLQPPDIIIYNEDTLRAEIKWWVPMVLSGHENDITLKMTVTYGEEGRETTVTLPLTRRISQDKRNDATSITHTDVYLLDSLFDGWRFKDLFTFLHGQLGGSFTLTAEVSYTGRDGDLQINPGRASETDNSLFAKDSTDTVANIAYMRHLQNLHPDLSAVSGSITTAVQTRTIENPSLPEHYEGKDVLEGTAPYHFTPIHNENLISYDGGRWEIRRLLVDATGTAGLFDDCVSAITDVRLMNPTVRGTEYAGTLCAQAKDGAAITGCQTYWVVDDASQMDLRYLLGTAAKDTYLLDNYMVSGGTAGGLVGAGENITIQDSSASTTVRGTTAGGLVGQGSGLNIQRSYADCYLTGGSAAGLVGELKAGTNANTFTNIYAAGFISNGGPAAGLYLGSGTASVHDSYAAMGYNKRNEANILPLAPGNNIFGEDVCYLMLNFMPESTVGGQGLDSVRLTELADEGSIPGFVKKGASSTRAYNLQEEMALTSYPYPGLEGLTHYGDWPDILQINSLVYWENYADRGDYTGIYGGNANLLRNDLGVVTNDGYAVVLDKTRVDALGGIVTVVYEPASSEKSEVEYSIDGREGTVPLVTISASIGGVEGSYYLAKLPNALVNTPTGNSEFYQRITITPTPSEGDGSTQSVTDTYYYNPHFANTALAAEADRVPDPPTSVAVRSPRHLYHLSRLGVYSNNTDANASEAVWGTVNNRRIDSNADQFPYLNNYTELRNGGTPAVRYWKQSHDVTGEGMSFTPIAGFQAQDSGTSEPLYGWFGGSYDGDSYTIQEVNIAADTACVGLFGVTYNATMQNIVMYSPSGAASVTRTGTSWYAVGGLVGLAATNKTDAAITNCAIAGYQIKDQSSNAGYGGGGVGGLLGICNMELKQCTAVTDISIGFTFTDRGRNIRVGGIAGSCQQSISSCYAGGSITITPDAAAKATRIHIGGIVGGAFMKTLTNPNDSKELVTDSAKNEFKNCYSFVSLPDNLKKLNLDKANNDHLFAIGGMGELDKASGYTNCYYLVLSSALQLVADDLTGAEYTCQVDYEREEWLTKFGNGVFHYFNSHVGKMTRADGSAPLFAGTFLPALDSISKGDIKGILEERYQQKELDESVPDNAYYWHGDYTSSVKEPQNFTLTVTAADGPLSGYTAQVDVKIDTNYRITLTARMTGAPDDKALELFKNYYLTTTLTRSGGITKLDIPEMTGDGTDVLTAGTITWKAGKVLREYRDTETLP